MPQNKRGAPEVKDDDKKKDDGKPKTLDQVAREVKDLLKKGLYK